MPKAKLQHRNIFKPGDRVVRVRSLNYWDKKATEEEPFRDIPGFEDCVTCTMDGRYFPLGEIFTVEACNKNYLQLENDWYNWPSCFFRKVK